jgi:clan AA aspartic protease (TIGR02281 family)
LCNIIAQDIVKLEKSGGVYLIPCKVNGLPLKFIYDTGASEVSISLTEALFMLKNGYLKESDIKGTVYYSIANGDIAEGTKINIQKVEVGKQTLYNVEASIVHSTEAPLLFGQSAMERFGRFTMDYSNSNLIIGGSSNTSSSNSTNSSTIKSVKIGTQTWMTENLNVDRFRNGDLIPEAKTDEEWLNAGKNKQPAWCYYDNNPVNGAKYGKLYNWYALNDPRGLSPKGWHVPSHNEFLILRKFIGQKEGGKKMKSTSDWVSGNPDVPIGNGTNSSGFNGLPGGMRMYNEFVLTASFENLHTSAEFWTSTTNYNQYTKDKNAKFFDLHLRVDWLDESHNDKGQGRSIRCIKD